MPTQFTITSILPMASTAALVAVRIEATSRASSIRPWALPPWARMRAASASALSRFGPAMVTSAPCPAMAQAIASPMAP